MANFPPRSLRITNRVIVAAHRLGVRLPMPTSTVVGRTSGKPRTTPVSPLEVNGIRYRVGGYGGSDWVEKARAAGVGVLTRGRRSERVRLVDLPEHERGPILREFPVRVPLPTRSPRPRHDARCSGSSPRPERVA